ncbi:MAG: iron-sulfur cluster assembly scaffold protein [Acidibrevibacterium sp.]|uniref:iron-sulfur cluster assembly scaffold protein n=1 Tax=Acidibrevibacterium fodinaquatile TaxID=1969806 RepID=UPI0023A7919B|nr:iron-sulfur cluster assembly scaffold protein [Acidibrevibacterium fodinaquatile]MCA7118732.1 iron-sulfur cluster assembly scaffold protein [Acidibrevibacterium fodinaquatile]
MFEDLRDLYQDVILDHGRRPRHSGKLAAYDATARGDNPLCGDRITLWLQYLSRRHSRSRPQAAP